MLKKINSLQTKLTTSFITLIFLVTGGSFILTFGQSKQALLDSTREDLQQTIGIASTQITAQEMQQISQLKAGDDQTPQYQAFQKRFRAMRAVSPSIVNFYILRIEGSKVTFLLDDAESSGASIGQVYDSPDPRLFEANDHPSVSDDLYTDEWGTFLSGYAPVKNSQGATIFVIGADMDAAKVIEKENFIGNTVYLVMGIAILIAGGMIGIFSLTIIRDVKKLNVAANKISLGDPNVTIDVKRQDEIGELADSFSRMVASLKIMMGMGLPDTGDPVAEEEPLEKA